MMIITKCIVIGDSGVGKSSLSSCYANGKNADGSHIPTIGIEFYPKKLIKNGKNINLHIWDTAGQERFRSIARSYYRDTRGAIICFSLANKESFDNILKFMDDLDNYSNDYSQKVLVGTCYDLKESRQVTREEAEELAKSIGLY